MENLDSKPRHMDDSTVPPKLLTPKSSLLATRYRWQCGDPIDHNNDMYSPLARAELDPVAYVHLLRELRILGSHQGVTGGG